MLSQPLKVWEKVELVVGEPPNAGRYLARIQDFINGGIVISEPEYLEGNTLLREDIDVYVLVTREDAIYQFHSQVKKMLSQTSRDYLLTPPRRFERVQRRMFARVEVTRRLVYAVIPPLGEWQSYDNQLTWHHSQTYDLSGGGLRFRVIEPLAVQTPVLLKVDCFPEMGLPEAVVAIARRMCRQREDHYCGAEFLTNEQMHLHLGENQRRALPKSITQFDRNGQNRLSAYVFNLQVTLRQKGLL
jgi:c-di-GMP-binding flagellar brake protein YcgR